LFPESFLLRSLEHRTSTIEHWKGCIFFPLTPPLSPGERENRPPPLGVIPATEFAKPVGAQHAPGGGCSLSPGERVRVRGNDGSTATEYRISKGLLGKTFAKMTDFLL